MPQVAPESVWSMRSRGCTTSPRLLLHSRDRGGNLAVVCRLRTSKVYGIVLAHTAANFFKQRINPEGLHHEDLSSRDKGQRPCTP